MRLDLGKFVEAAGAVALGQMQGKMQGQQLLQQQQEEDFARQMQALTLQRQLAGDLREQQGAGLETILKHGLRGLTPEAQSQVVSDVVGRQGEIARTPMPGLGALRIPQGPRWEGVRGILTPPTPVADPAQQARIRALQGLAPLIPGGRNVLKAIETPTPAPIPAQQPPPTETPAPPPTVQFPGLSGRYEVETVDPKVVTELNRARAAVNKNLVNVPPGAVPTVQGWLKQWIDRPRNREDVAHNQQILRTLEGLGVGTGPALQRLDFQKEEAERKALEEAPTQLQGMPLNERSVPSVVAQLENYLEREDAINAGRATAGKPKSSVIWNANRAKVAAASQALAQGNVPEAIRLAGEVMDLVASPHLDPKAQIAAMGQFLKAVQDAPPSELADPAKVAALAKEYHVERQVANMQRLGWNFAAGPAEKQIMETLGKVGTWAKLDPTSKQVFIDRIVPLSRLTKTPIPLNAKFVLEMTEKERKQLAQGDARIQLQGARNEIARGQLAISYSVLDRLWQEAGIKLSQAAQKGTQVPSTVYTIMRDAEAASRREYEKAADSVGLLGIFDPKKPRKDEFSKKLGDLYDRWQQKATATRNLAKQRYNLDVESGSLGPAPTVGPGGQLGVSIQMRPPLQGGPPPPSAIPGLGGAASGLARPRSTAPTAPAPTPDRNTYLADLKRRRDALARRSRGR